MIRTDGAYVCYLIQTRDESKKHKDGAWFEASLDYFGSPEGFNACGDCWQRTGVHGTFNEKEARAGLVWMRERHPGKPFRLIALHITQMRVAVYEAPVKRRGVPLAPKQKSRRRSPRTASAAA